MSVKISYDLSFKNFKYSKSGYTEVRKSQAVLSELMKHATEFCSQAEAASGDEYKVTSWSGTYLNRTSVTPASARAYFRNQKYNFLGKVR